MTKAEVISILQKQLAEKVGVMKSALAVSNEGSSGDEAKSEGKYDTRAIEAAYLAEAQAEQLTQAEAALDVFQRFEASDYEISDAIGPGALVEAEVDGDLSFFFLAPTGGGLTTDFLGCELTVITPDSRLYQSLVDKKMGDTLETPSLTIMGLE
ncbi:hypothetical protein N9230_01900 [Akkermansiaceae bacterium]|nr:hypothetical protein [Akkermansiaceae bacterium]